jgi:hypothetical protein
MKGAGRGVLGAEPGMTNGCPTKIKEGLARSLASTMAEMVMP